MPAPAEPARPMLTNWEAIKYSPSGVSSRSSGDRVPKRTSMSPWMPHAMSGGPAGGGGCWAIPTPASASTIKKLKVVLNRMDISYGILSQSRLQVLAAGSALESHRSTLRNRFIVTIAAAATILFAAGAAPAQQLDRPATISGHPNFNGIWQALNTAYWNLESHSVEGLSKDYWQLGA